MKKRILSVLLSLCMALALLPTAALAIEPTEVWVGGVNMCVSGNEYLKNDASSGTPTTGTAENYNAKYENGVLKLRNFEYTGDGHRDGAIFADGDLTIELVGNNRVTITSSNHGFTSDRSCGVYCGHDLTVRGSGSLTATGGTASSRSCGIFAADGGSITITGSAVVNAIGGTGANGGNSFGISSDVGAISISGSAVVNATGGDASNIDSYSGHAGMSRGISSERGAVNISGSATVNATGGNGGKSYGVYGGTTVSFTGSAVVNAIGGELAAANGISYGVYGGSVSISGGTVIATGGEARDASAISYGVYGGSSVAFSGGVTVARAGMVGMSYDNGGNNKRYAVYCGGANNITGINTTTQIAGAVKHNGGFDVLSGAGANENTIKKDSDTATGVVIVPNGWTASNTAVTLESSSATSFTYADNTHTLSDNYAIVTADDTADDTALSVTGDKTLSVADGKTLLAVSLAEGSSSTTGILSTQNLRLTGGGRIIAVGGLPSTSGSSIGLSGSFTVDTAALIAYGSTQALDAVPGGVTAAAMAAPAGVLLETGTLGSYKLVSILPCYHIASDGGLLPAPKTKWEDVVTTAPAGYEVDVSGNNITISSAEGLAWLAKQVNGNDGFSVGKTVTLTADVNMSAHIWTPIGTGAEQYRFKGTFDGNGKTVSGLYYNVGVNLVGLFGIVGSGGTVKNVNVAHSYLRGSSSENIFAGGVVGNNVSGTVTDCTSSAIVIGAGSRFNNVGGVVGQNSDGTVTNCSNIGSVSATDGNATNRVGGVVGYNYSDSGTAEVTNCYNIASISATGVNANVAGGVVGFNCGSGGIYSAKVTNCYNTGNVSATGGVTNNAGGVAGRNSGSSPSEITNCYNTGSVSATGGVNINCAGGVVGDNDVGTITNCYSAAASVTGGASTTGGVAGQKLNGSITNCYYKKAVGSTLGIGSSNADTAGVTTGLYDGETNSQMKAAAGVTNGTDWSPINVGSTSIMIPPSLVSALNVGVLAYSGTAASWGVKSGINNGYPTFKYPITVTDPQNGTLRVADANNAAVTEGVTGETITVTAAPAGGYTLDAVTVTQTGGSATIPVTNNSTFTMPSFPVTVAATFTQSSGGYYVPIDVTVYNDSDAAGATAWLTGAGLTNGDRLVTEELSSGADYDAMLKLANSEDIIRIYNIYLKSGKTGSGSAMYLNFKLSAQYAGQALSLVHKKADGTFEYFHATADANGNVRFGPLYELSPFMLVKGTITAEDAPLPFTDVAESDYYHDAVRWAVRKDITDGTTDTTFSPGLTCTRAQAVTFLWRAMGEPEPTASVNPFTDVAADAYYYKAVLWAVEKGVTDGASDTTFSPNEDCTRGQIVTFQYRLAGSPAAGKVNPFSDVAADAYYADAVLWAVAKGVTDGASDTTFSPNEDCTRAQIVTFLYRQLGK